MLYDMMRDRIYCWYSNNQNFLLNYVSGICLLSFSFFFFFWLLKTIDNNDILVINVNDPRMQVIHNFIIIEDKTRHDIVVVNWFLEFLLCMDLLLFCKKKNTTFSIYKNPPRWFGDWSERKSQYMADSFDSYHCWLWLWFTSFIILVIFRYLKYKSPLWWNEMKWIIIIIYIYILIEIDYKH